MEGFDIHTGSQRSLFPVSSALDRNWEEINDIQRGAAYYIVVLCTFTISIPGTMRKEVCQATFHEESLKLTPDWHRCISHWRTQSEWLAKGRQMFTHKVLLISLVILIPCVACSRLILSLRGLYYSQMVVGPTTLGTQTKGEYKPSIRVALPSTPSSGAATSLDTSHFVIHTEENDGVHGRSEEADVGLESRAQGRRRDSTVHRRLTTGKWAAA